MIKVHFMYFCTVKIIVLLILLISLISCKDKQITYELIGTITDINTGSPINNAKISISQKEVTTTALNPNYVFVTKTTSNSDGNYNLLYNREKVIDFKLEIESDNHYFYETIILPNDLSTETATKNDFELTAKGWVKVRLINSDPEDGEQLNFYKHNVKTGCEDCCENGYTIINDQTPDTNFTCPIVGNNYFKYSYGQTNSNNSITDSIYCAGMDTTLLKIFY